MSQGGLLVLIAALAAQAHVQAERACMAEAIYYEARGEGPRGQEAMAEVILQRMRSGDHPQSVCGVVHEPHQFSYRRWLNPAQTGRQRMGSKLRPPQLTDQTIPECLSEHGGQAGPKISATAVYAI